MEEKKQTPFDTWRTGSGPLKKYDDFTFLDQHGSSTNVPPVDFMPISQIIGRQNGEDVMLNKPNSRMLFANASVPKGDRVGVEVYPAHYQGFTHEWMKNL